MPPLPDYFEYLSACKVILCKAHCLCLRQPDVEPHLRSMHNITGAACDALVHAMSDLEIAVSMADVCLPVAGSAPIKGLPIFDGFECCATKGCPYLTPYWGSLRTHMSNNHSTFQKYKRKIEYHNQVKLQRFFPGSSSPGYVIVDLEGSKHDFPQVSAMVKEYSMQPSSSQNSRAEVIDLEEEEEASGGGVGSAKLKNSNY